MLSGQREATSTPALDSASPHIANAGEHGSGTSKPAHSLRVAQARHIPRGKMGGSLSRTLGATSRGAACDAINPIHKAAGPRAHRHVRVIAAPTRVTAFESRNHRDEEAWKQEGSEGGAWGAEREGRDRNREPKREHGVGTREEKAETHNILTDAQRAGVLAVPQMSCSLRAIPRATTRTHPRESRSRARAHRTPSAGDMVPNLRNGSGDRPERDAIRERRDEIRTVGGDEAEERLRDNVCWGEDCQHDARENEARQSERQQLDTRPFAQRPRDVEVSTSPRLEVWGNHGAYCSVHVRLVGDIVARNAWGVLDAEQGRTCLRSNTKVITNIATTKHDEKERKKPTPTSSQTPGKVSTCLHGFLRIPEAQGDNNRLDQIMSGSGSKIFEKRLALE
ncbi:hypothetical protein B0H13DRAFT_1883113 [Mycena leptocephala]|nr:hypothetical protein B0H13DRAFT_1883113 [Mycena leptocephala]